MREAKGIFEQYRTMYESFGLGDVQSLKRITYNNFHEALLKVLISQLPQSPILKYMENVGKKALESSVQQLYSSFMTPLIKQMPADLIAGLLQDNLVRIIESTGLEANFYENCFGAKTI
jgi:hypothetical protein